jgi:bla regulator protein BlaR1
VLLHELEHVRRRDWPVHIAARLVTALYWFHPLVWIAWRQLCLEAERACDDAVLREESGADYANQLVSLARRLTRDEPLPLLSIAGRSHLSTRVTAMLASNVTRGRVGIATAVALVSLAVISALGIGPLQAVASIQRRAALSGLAFETTSIHPTTASAGRCCQVRYGEEGRVTGVNVDMVDLVVSAYNLYRWQIVGAPDWAGGKAVLAPSDDADRFDLQATAQRSARSDDMRLMLKTLLADRFRLTVHPETRTQTIYELVVEPGGSRLQPPGLRPFVAEDDVWLRVDAENLMATLDVDQMTTAGLARHLGGILRTTVIDRTGLTGAHRVHARWDANPNRPDVLQQPVSDSPRDPGRPTIFEAFPEQLGLRLRETTGDVNYLVVDHAERIL